MNSVREVAKKDALDMTKEDIFSISYAAALKMGSDEKEAKKYANASTFLFIRAREKRQQNPQDYEIWGESLKVEIAFATDGPMPPKRFVTNPYFPNRFAGCKI